MNLTPVIRNAELHQNPTNQNRIFNFSGRQVALKMAASNTLRQTQYESARINRSDFATGESESERDSETRARGTTADTNLGILHVCIANLILDLYAH